MRISTNAFYQRAIDQLTNKQSSVADLQARLASGKKVLNASDAPDRAALILRLKSAMTQQSNFEHNLNAIEDRMTAEESVISSASDLMQRVRELAVQGSSDTLGADGRAIIAQEVSNLRDELFNLANQKDAGGNYVFSGSKTSTQPFVDDGTGQIVYAGDSDRITVNVSEFRQLTINKPGDEVFTAVIRDENGVETRQSFFAVLHDFEAALRNNDSAAISASFSEIDQVNKGLGLALADTGSRMAAVESQRSILEETKLRYQTLLSNEEDLDYATAVTELSREMLALEAAQASFSKVSQLSLFNYLR
jgi:flagellar hook-associated protein 3 FlgL